MNKGYALGGRIVQFSQAKSARTSELRWLSLRNWGVSV